MKLNTSQAFNRRKNGQLRYPSVAPLQEAFWKVYNPKQHVFLYVFSFFALPTTSSYLHSVKMFYISYTKSKQFNNQNTKKKTSTDIPAQATKPPKKHVSGIPSSARLQLKAEFSDDFPEDGLRLTEDLRVGGGARGSGGRCFFGVLEACTGCLWILALTAVVSSC